MRNAVHKCVGISAERPNFLNGVGQLLREGVFVCSDQILWETKKQA